MSAGDRCRECGTVIPADSPGGFCAQCLLRLGLGEEGGGQGAEDGGRKAEDGGRKTEVRGQRSLGDKENPVDFESPPAVGNLEGSSVVFSLTEKPGDWIGRYRLVQEIGHGGCGVVYMAEQEQPVRRKVALKVIKLGMDTRQVVARFQAERQALALMDHTNIARVLDAGATDTGRPYFVMELVGGIRITDFCDQNKLTIRERLELFIQVCRAIQHAHQKGVIHRDIKPSNVLVAVQDGVPAPKVIDFGIAKATQGRLTDQTLFTAFEQFLGTPAYMSPEQTQLGSLDVDTRSDIYSLGVLLYELLTGRTPFDTKELAAAGLDEMRRTIREVEPPRPSTRLARQTAVPQSPINRDLDWIVMKCLEKDRARRYETANAVAMDVERHLNNEPVVARPPGKLYEFQKTFQRHKFGFAATAGIILVLAAGTTLSTWQAVRATRAQHAEAQERELAEASEKKAVSQKEIAMAIQNFLERDLLLQVDPGEQAQAIRTRGSGRAIQENPTIKELLERATIELAPDKIETKFPSQADVQASLLETIGNAFAGIGEYGRAEEFLTRASELSRSVYGAEDTNTLRALRSLAWAYRNSGKLSQATELFERVRDAQVKQSGIDDPETMTSLRGIAQCYEDAGKTPEAIELLEQVWHSQEKKLGADDPATLTTIGSLANEYQGAGRYSEAIKLFERVRDARSRQLGANDPNTMRTMSFLANSYLHVGEISQAIELLESVRSNQLSHLGADNPDTLATLVNLGYAYSQAHRLPEAIKMLEQVRDVYVRKLGVDHPVTLRAMRDLGGAYIDAGELTRAIELLEQVRDGQTRKLGPGHPELLATLDLLAWAYQRSGKLPRAIALLEQVSEVTPKKFGADHPNSFAAFHNLGSAYWAAGRLDDALPLYRRAVEGFAARGFRDTQADQAVHELIGLLAQRKDYDEAQKVCWRWSEAVMARDGSNSTAYADSLTYLGSKFTSWKQWTDAEVALRKALELCEREFPEDWRTFNVRSVLGDCLAKQKKFADAEPLLISGYEGMKDRKNKIPVSSSSRLKGALQRLVKFYETTKRAGQTVRWKAELTEWYRNEAERLRKEAEGGDVAALNRVSWFLATCADSAVRDGVDAVAYGEKAVEASNWKDPAVLDTLAAAYAETRDFIKATGTQKEAVAVVEDASLKQQLAARLKLYEAKAPYHEY